MEQFLFLLPALLCPIGMGAAMWFMMRGRDRGAAPGAASGQAEELARLRAEIDSLRTSTAPFDQRHPAPTSGHPRG